jgi:hypothetical protein
MKAIAIIIGILLIGGCVYFVSESSKPAVVARIEFSKSTLYVTNGNDRAWPRPTIILNDAFGGPRLETREIAPGEKRSLPLNEFVGLHNRQRFNPEFERVTEVMIEVDGFQIGAYRK